MANAATRRYQIIRQSLARRIITGMYARAINHAGGADHAPASRGRRGGGTTTISKMCRNPLRKHDVRL